MRSVIIFQIFFGKILRQKNNEHLESKIQNKFSIKMFIQEISKS